MIFAFGRLLESRQVDAVRFAAPANHESAAERVHRTVLAAVRAGRFDARLEALARTVFRSSGEANRETTAESPRATGPVVPVARPPEPLAVELEGNLAGTPGARLDLVIRAVGRDSRAPIAEARVHAQLLAEGGKVRASLSGATDAAGRLGMRIQLPSLGSSSLALRVEYGGETILLRQDLSAG